VSRPVAVVTGANRGIGYEVCRQLAGLDFDVVLGSRDSSRGEAAAAELGVVACQLDVADSDSVQAAADWVNERFGRCDALVNNAAIHYDTWQTATAADLHVVHEAMETNLFGAWRTALALLPLLRASEHGRIVNVSSGAGQLSSMGAGPPAYQVSKAALNALTRTLAAELRRDRRVGQRDLSRLGGHRHGRPRRAPGRRRRRVGRLGRHASRRRADRRLLPRRPSAGLVAPARPRPGLKPHSTVVSALVSALS
jgi:NADP-dependent 3-hydroxy acid dehydrogenase YdfG